jgi:Ca2+-binding EF-hand superfamily protein
MNSKIDYFFDSLRKKAAENKEFHLLLQKRKHTAYTFEDLLVAFGFPIEEKKIWRAAFRICEEDALMSYEKLLARMLKSSLSVFAKPLGFLQKNLSDVQATRETFMNAIFLGTPTNTVSTVCRLADKLNGDFCESLRFELIFSNDSLSPLIQSSATFTKLEKFRLIDEILSTIFSSCDESTTDPRDYMAGFIMMTTASPKEKLKAMVRLVDRDMDGVLSAAEINELLTLIFKWSSFARQTTLAVLDFKLTNFQVAQKDARILMELMGIETDSYYSLEKLYEIPDEILPSSTDLRRFLDMTILDTSSEWKRVFALRKSLRSTVNFIKAKTFISNIKRSYTNKQIKNLVRTMTGIPIEAASLQNEEKPPLAPLTGDWKKLADILHSKTGNSDEQNQANIIKLKLFKDMKEANQPINLKKSSVCKSAKDSLQPKVPEEYTNEAIPRFLRIIKGEEAPKIEQPKKLMISKSL